MAGRRILFLAPRYPYPPLRGDQVRAFHLIRCLAIDHEVTVVCFDSGPKLPIDGVRVVTVGRNVGSIMAGNLAQPRPSIPAQVRLFLSRRMARVVAHEAARRDLDVVHITLARMAPYMPGRRPRLHRHLDLVDTLSLNMDERARGERAGVRALFRLEARMMRRYEARTVAAAESASVVSEADREALGDPGAAVIPNGVDQVGFPFAEPAGGPPRLIFFGNLGYFHNVEPARFVAQRILPLVAQRVPQARLRIVGARPSPRVRALDRLPGVDVAADVPSMADELHRASVAVLPLFTGSGIKNKLLEAFASGLPVVANAAGTAGIDGLVPGTHCRVGEGPEALAAAIVELLGSLDERRRLARAAVRLVSERYSWQRQAQRLLELYEKSD